MRTSSVSLPTSQLQTLLDSLDKAGGISGKKPQDGRHHRRLRYRTRRVLVRVLDERSREEAVFKAPTRNISSRGLSFLHKQMLPPGKRLTVSIPLLDDQTIHVIARVIHCRHIRGMMHEIGIRLIEQADDIHPLPQ